MAALKPALVAALSLLDGLSSYGPAIRRAATLSGVTRVNINTPVLRTEDFISIQDTTYCEDIHHHTPSGLLFTACDDNTETRPLWFPGLNHLDDPIKGTAQKGSIHVIDPKDMSQKRLEFENFNSTFVTHGIDVISDPQSQEAVYIFAVNHIPHPDYLATKIKGLDNQTVTQKAQSRIEIFHHILGSYTAKHLRSVLHPLVKTPNDIFIKDPQSFYVTNDHYHPEGIGRVIEDVWPDASWTDTIYIHLDSLSAQAPTDGVKAEVAFSKLRNNNGLGHRKSDEIVIVNCANGEVHIGQLSSDRSITTVESFQVDSYVDNPSWFDDPYRSETHDASGFVLAGLTRPIDMPQQGRDPKANIGSIVWYVKPIAGTSGGYEKRVVFEDDGARISSAASAVLVAIDPAKENGQKKAWLFMTGFMSRNVVAVKVDL
ncbi:hypothetical protein EsH8_VII_000193 [Colletotrichum jinshuiense]